jgi:hypothetical protein
MTRSYSHLESSRYPKKKRSVAHSAVRFAGICTLYCHNCLLPVVLKNEMKSRKWRSDGSLRWSIVSAQSLAPMTSRDSPPLRTGSPNAMLKRAFSLPISQMAWREMRRGSPAQCLEQRKVPVMHDLAPG